MGRKKTRCMNTVSHRWVSWFGLDPGLCSFLWNELRGYRRNSRKKAKEHHLLWALTFLKCYTTNAVHASKLTIDEKTFRKWVWFILKGISMLHTQFICSFFLTTGILTSSLFSSLIILYNKYFSTEKVCKLSTV